MSQICFIIHLALSGTQCKRNNKKKVFSVHQKARLYLKLMLFNLVLYQIFSIIDLFCEFKIAVVRKTILFF